MTMVLVISGTGCGVDGEAVQRQVAEVRACEHFFAALDRPAGEDREQLRQAQDWSRQAESNDLTLQLGFLITALEEQATTAIRDGFETIEPHCTDVIDDFEG